MHGTDQIDNLYHVIPGYAMYIGLPKRYEGLHVKYLLFLSDFNES